MAEATKRFELKMPGNQVVQKFYLDSDNTAYALQMYGNSGKDMKLCYGTIDPNQAVIDFTKPGFTQINLYNFGHGQTFEPFTDSAGNKWAWVATYASSTEKDNFGASWASRIGVIKLDGQAKNASDVPAITALNAQPLFEALQSGSVNAKTDSRMVKSDSFYVSSRNITKYVYPQKSWQEMELSDKRSPENGGYNWLYFTSGQADAKSKPMIIRAPWNIFSATPVERVMTFKDLSGAVEIEAPQLTGNDILFGIEQGPSGNKTHYIYSVKKSIF
ncbi:MAG: class III bacteriocin [Lentilactobacillus diolivorans]|jgi:hypothetical protein|nr:class III bacteriocin [Lentilactobacillus diolivorans]RRG03776.1 MAG: hypothetical protein DUD34_02480 [Lactobacillus sp.]